MWSGYLPIVPSSTHRRQIQLSLPHESSSHFCKQPPCFTWCFLYGTEFLLHLFSVFFFKGHIPSVKDLLAQVLGMCSADGLQCHFLRGLFHWQRVTNLKSHPVSVWSTSNDWLIWGYKSLVISVQNVTSLTSHFSYRAASRSAEVIVGLHYNLTSPSVVNF